jgi:hypothetical protein
VLTRGVLFGQTSLTGETVKTTRICLLLLAVFLCLPVPGFAQSNAKPDYKHQHKSAQKYQKTLMKEQHRQDKVNAKKAKAYRKEHQ